MMHWLYKLLVIAATGIAAFGYARSTSPARVPAWAAAAAAIAAAMMVLAPL